MRAREFIKESKSRPNIEIRWDGNFIVKAYINGEFAGSAEFASDDPEGRYGFYAIDVGVVPKYRRMGVATAMYNAARERFGDIEPSQHQTDDARAFWQSYGREVVGENTENLNYQGNCTEDDVIEHIFGDATHFAQLVDEYGDEFELDDLVVKYNPETDVHSFYYKNTA